MLQRELCGIKHVFTKREIKDFRNLVELRKAGRVGPNTLCLKIKQFVHYKSKAELLYLRDHNLILNIKALLCI